MKNKFWLILSFTVTLYAYSSNVYAWTVPCCSYDSTCCKESVQLKAVIKATTSTKGKDAIIHTLIERLLLEENVSMDEITEIVQQAVLSVDDSGPGGEPSPSGPIKK